MTKEWADRLPGSIRISGLDYRVELWDNHRSASSRAWGECSSTELRISIQSDHPSLAKMVDTVLHEVLHGIYWAYVIEDEDKEERIVTTMARAWAQVWRDNPALLDWLGAASAEVRK